MIVPPSYDDVRAAAARLAGIAHRTPVITSRSLDGRAGCSVFLKCECFQRMGAFKFRGAYNAVAQLSPEDRAKGVVTHSSGNHAQALALAAQMAGVKAVVVMPRGTSPPKLAATRDTYGAQVVLCENNLASRESTTRSLVEERGLVMVHPYDDDRIIAGAGTAALELLEDTGGLDVVVAPVGGGGLMSGTCIAARGTSAAVRLYGAEPQRADDALRSLQAGRVVANPAPPDTVADGLRTNLCERTFSVLSRHLDAIATVSEGEILDAMRFLWERLKIVVEPSGAVPVAALLSGRIDVSGRRVGVIVSGGNVDLARFFEGMAGPR
jgi:threonine dehydratase